MTGEDEFHPRIARPGELRRVDNNVVPVRRVGLLGVAAAVGSHERLNVRVQAHVRSVVGLHENDVVGVDFADRVGDPLVHAHQMRLLKFLVGSGGCVHDLPVEVQVVHVPHELAALFSIEPHGDDIPGRRRSVAQPGPEQFGGLADHERLAAQDRRPRKRFVHQVVSNDGGMVRVPFGHMAPRGRVVVLNAEAVRSRRVRPEVLKRALNGRAGKVGVAPDVAPVDVRLVVRQRGPFGRAVGIQHAVEILVHVEKDVQAMVRSPRHALIHRRQVRVVVHARFGFQTVPDNPQTDHVHAPVPQPGEIGLAVPREVIALGRFVHDVHPVQQNLPPFRVDEPASRRGDETGRIHRRPCRNGAGLRDGFGQGG